MDCGPGVARAPTVPLLTGGPGQHNRTASGLLTR